jgi:hypothetical protein
MAMGLLIFPIEISCPKAGRNANIATNPMYARVDSDVSLSIL